MKLLRGKYKGQVYEIGQMANDWITIARSGVPISPTTAAYTKEEIQRLEDDRNAGLFWSWYEVVRDEKAEDEYQFRLQRVKPI